MPVTTADLDRLIVFDGEARVAKGYDNAGAPNAWEIIEWPERGSSWDKTVGELGYQELGRWAGTLSLAHTGNRDAARLLLEKLAALEPPIVGSNNDAFFAGVDRVPGMLLRGDK